MKYLCFLFMFLGIGIMSPVYAKDSDRTHYSKAKDKPSVSKERGRYKPTPHWFDNYVPPKPTRQTKGDWTPHKPYTPRK